MESEIRIFEPILFFLLILFSALFSGAETAFLSLARYSPAEIEAAGPRLARRLQFLQSRIQELLIAILVGNTIANLSAATIAAFMASKIAVQFQLNESLILLVEVLVVTGMLLLCSEITPKFMAIKDPIRFARFVSTPILFFFYLFKPITYILNFLTTGVARLLGVASKIQPLREEELRELIEVGGEHGALLEDEREMIHSFFEFRETQVKEIMVPRIDMVCIEKDASLKELVNLIQQKGHTRIPLYEGTIDNIMGIIHAKDLLPYLNEKEKEVNLAQLARPALYVPEYKHIDELLKEFQKEKMHMAIVVDEYGGTAGLITLEDILEEIVGEIQDEYDIESPLIRKISENAYLVNAKIDLHDLNEELNINLPTNSDYESLGGFIFSLTGAVPKEQEVISYKDFLFTIEKVDRNRIVQVRLEKVQRESDLTPQLP